MTQAVHVRVGHALHAVATYGVRLRYGDASLKKQLDDLVVVSVGGQDDGGDVWGEVGELLVQQDKRHLVQREWGDEGGTTEDSLLCPNTAGAELIVWTCVISSINGTLAIKENNKHTANGLWFRWPQKNFPGLRQMHLFFPSMLSTHYCRKTNKWV